MDMKKNGISNRLANVPMVMQMEALECGAAALAMILAYFEKWIPLEEARLHCGVSRDGSNARNILKAARQYGLDAKGYHYETEILKTLPIFPCILFWEYSHFVVLDGFRHNKAVINDPARGRIEITMKEFELAYTGICLCFQPTKDFIPSGKKKSIWSFARKKLSGVKGAMIFVAVTTLLTSCFELLFPVFSQVFVDRLLTGRNQTWIYGFFSIMIIMTLFYLIVGWIQSLYALKLEGKLAIISNTQFMWHVLRLPLSFFSQRNAGDIVLRKSNNEDTMKVLVETLAPLTLHTCMMLCYLVVMMRYQMMLCMIGIFGTLCNVGLSRLISKKRVNVNRVLAKNEGMLWSNTIAGMELIESIKASGAEEGFFERWAGTQASVNTQKIKHARINQTWGNLTPFLIQMMNLVILAMGVTLIINGSFTIGMLYAFQGLMASFLQPVNVLMNSGQLMQEMRVNMERTEDVLAYEPDVKECTDINENQTYEKLQGAIELHNVSFGYSKLADPLIEDVSLHVGPGKKIAFVGGSGSGKSTLSKLITGLVQPWSGEILFDGVPIQEIDRNVFTSSVAVVDQEITLFEDSVSQNIKLWDSSIKDFEMILAARDAGIHSDILQKEGGYEHPVSTGGSEFSGGQRQRLEIARVLAQDPTILILDEATSALDAKTEYEVVASIQKRGITTIVIAHRLSTIRDCDEIIVLDHGHIVERGTHEELYTKQGYYTKLVTSE